jgi:DNA-binding transcriptional LysR family regulator
MVQISSTDVSWDDLAAIRAVAKTRSIRRAATAMGVAHTTLARRIEAAELALGIVAFVRSVRGYVPTEAGLAILAHIDRMADEAESLARAVAGGDLSPKGVVRVSLPPAVLTHYLLHALPQFQARFPDISLDFDTQYSYSNLDRHESDIAIRYQNTPEDHLVGTCVGTSQESAYATPAQIALIPSGQARLIAWSRGEVFRRRAAVFGLGEAEIGFLCVDVEGQIGLAEAGLGIAFLATGVGDRLAKLRRVDPDKAISLRRVWVLTHPDLRKSARIRAVTGFLVDTLRFALA